MAAVKNGLPFDVAFAADDDFVLAWIVANGENGGGTFDWDFFTWAER